MIRTITLAGWLALSLVGVAGCGGAASVAQAITEGPTSEGPPAPLRVEQPFFIPGERMAWELSLRGIIGGEAVLGVGEPGVVDGDEVIIISSRTESAGLVKLIKDVRDEVTTWVALATGAPVFHRADLRFGDRRTFVETRFAEHSFDMQYRRDSGHLVEHHTDMPKGEIAFDAHAILGVVRAWDEAPGARAYFYALAGRRMWRNTIRVGKPETIKTALGVYPARRIDGVATRLNRMFAVDHHKQPRSYTVWISDDGNRMPLRVTAKTEFGDVKVELVEYTRPNRHVVSR